MRDKLEQLRADLEQVNEEYRLKSEELLEITSKKEALDVELANSPLKRQASKIFVTIFIRSWRTIVNVMVFKWNYLSNLPN